MELPWIPSLDHKGGQPFKSCVPDGVYRLDPYSSEKHPNVWSLSNPDLDVYVNPGQPGRYAILIHVGNSTDDVVGCIAVGLTADPLHSMIRRSGDAIDLLRSVLKTDSHILEISPKGAKND